MCFVDYEIYKLQVKCSKDCSSIALHVVRGKFYLPPKHCTRMISLKKAAKMRIVDNIKLF